MASHAAQSEVEQLRELAQGVCAPLVLGAEHAAGLALAHHAQMRQLSQRSQQRRICIRDPAIVQINIVLAILALDYALNALKPHI